MVTPKKRGQRGKDRRPRYTASKKKTLEMVREMGKKGLFAVQITERLGLTQRKHAEMMTIDLDLRDAYDDAARSAIAFWIDWLQDKLLNNKAIQHGAYQMMMTNLANWGAKSIADSTSAVEVIVKGGDQIGLPDGAHALNPTPNLHETKSNVQ